MVRLISQSVISKYLFSIVLIFYPLVLFSRRTVVSIPCGPSALAVKEAEWGLARYAAISQVGYLFGA